MSAKKSQSVSFSQSLSAEDKKHYNHVLVVAQDGMTYLFSNEAATVGIISPRVIFKNFDDFTTKASDLDLRTYWSQTHATPLDEKEFLAKLDDKVEFAVECWILLCKTAANRLKEVRQVGTDGKPVRVMKKMENRHYELIKSEVPADLKMPPQAKTCLTFFVELQAKDTEAKKAANPEYDPADAVFSVLEKDFNAYVLTNAERLKTRQDPWRIFQYYRPELIKNGFIRLV